MPKSSEMTELMMTLLPAVVLLLMTIRSLLPSAVELVEVSVPPVMVAALAPNDVFTKMPPVVIVLVLGPLKVIVSGALALLKSSEAVVEPAAGASFAVTLVLFPEAQVSLT